jgi:hypothetical protein
MLNTDFRAANLQEFALRPIKASQILPIKIALQRYLLTFGELSHAPSSMGQVGTMVSGLDPGNLVDQSI